MKQYNFKDVKFMTVKEKELVLKQWNRFIKALTEDEVEKIPNRFTKRIYEHLHLHCSFIAHYGISGFYNTYFADPEDTVKFIRQFDRNHDCISVEYNATWWLHGDYADLNEALIDVVEQYKEKIYEKCNSEARENDIQEAKRLLTKHSIEVVI